MSTYSNQIDIVRSEANLGFARAVNRAAARLPDHHLLLLNPDAVILPHALWHLFTTLRATPTIGAIAPLVVHPEGRLSVASGGSFPTALRMFTHYSGLSRLARWLPFLRGHYELIRGMAGKQTVVDWASGGCLLVRAEAWRRLGGLTQRWFMYAEDVEFCWRLSQAGYEVMIDADVTATHVVGASAEASTGPPSTAWLLNLLDFYRKDLSSSSLAARLWCLIVGTGLLIRAVLYRAREASSSADGGAWGPEAAKFASYAVAALGWALHLPARIANEPEPATPSPPGHSRNAEPDGA